MNTYYRLIIVALSLVIFNACDQNYIDGISKVDPGEDQTPPVVLITSPTGDLIIPFTDTETDVEFRFEVTDDIEVQSVTLSLDGTQLKSYSDFIDYRRFLNSYTHENLAIGNHTVQIVATDMTGKSTTKTLAFEVSNKYTAKYAGEIFYMPFEAGLNMELINEVNATKVGNPGFANGKIGKAYAGATDAYLTFPTTGLQGNQFSAVFWMKVNAVPDRAGILVMSPEDPGNAGYPLVQNNRTTGFRFLRENAGGKQRFKLNVGNGTADVWFDGGTAADVDPATGNWVHFAFTISGTECVVYINGQVVKQGAFTGIDWTGCNVFSIMSGAPRFTGWNHWSDLSLLDELRLFNKALTQTEVQAIWNAEK
ncbi:LamG domain-containing protein [Gaoshiqia sp. Z1-71]|uniref:LamG domain-containing protein n=1 Tax=Gaoshiqia hydrogeniformans TaxID=3290090 RepID=UPI003BF8E68D